MKQAINKINKRLKSRMLIGEGLVSDGHFLMKISLLKGHMVTDSEFCYELTETKAKNVWGVDEESIITFEHIKPMNGDEFNRKKGTWVFSSGAHLDIQIIEPVIDIIRGYIGPKASEIVFKQAKNSPDSKIDIWLNGEKVAIVMPCRWNK